MKFFQKFNDVWLKSLMLAVTVFFIDIVFFAGTIPYILSPAGWLWYFLYNHAKSGDTFFLSLLSIPLMFLWLWFECYLVTCLFIWLRGMFTKPKV